MITELVTFPKAAPFPPTRPKDGYAHFLLNGEMEFRFLRFLLMGGVDDPPHWAPGRGQVILGWRL